MLGLREGCTHLAVAETKLSINVANAVQDQGVAGGLVLTPDDHTEHDTYQEYPPDSTCNHGYLSYRFCLITASIGQKKSIVYVGHGLNKAAASATACALVDDTRPWCTRLAKLGSPSNA